jgi:GNAT superfamily N-acetyltransferase
MCLDGKAPAIVHCVGRYAGDHRNCCARRSVGAKVNMDLVLRETLPADIEELFSVRARTRENPISKEGLASIGITPESIAREMASGRMKGWVCLDGSTLVGFCNGDGETGEVLVLAVLPDYERRGIGTGLLSRVVEWLRSVSSNSIWLAASPDARIRAHGFYRSLGWRPNGKKQQNGDEILVLEQSAS